MDDRVVVDGWSWYAGLNNLGCRRRFSFSLQFGIHAMVFVEAKTSRMRQRRVFMCNGSGFSQVPAPKRKGMLWFV